MLSSACGNKLPEDISSCCFDNNNKPALIPPSESDESFSSAEQSTRSESGELEMDWSLLDSKKDVLRGKKSVLVDNSLSKARIRTGRVAWGELGVRLFSVMPGDHPDCLQGPPLTLEWKYFDQVNTTIDIFEEQRPQRKHHDDLRLHWIVRTRLLKSLGFGIAELTEAQNDSHRTRQKRDLTLKRVNYDWFYEFQQSLLRKVGRLFVHRKVLTTSY